MKSIYIAISYTCNHLCTCCPCDDKNKRNQSLSLKSIKSFVDDAGYNFYVVSGGEPTLHSEFCEIIAYLSRMGDVVILSNGDKFHDTKFSQLFLSKINRGNVSITTTLHSHDKTKHELRNRCEGSFFRTLKGLDNLYKGGIHICIKHCITPDNYLDLEDFVEFVNCNFPDDVSLQFSGIDYAGVYKRNKVMVKNLNQFNASLENALDKIITCSSKGHLRNVYCVNIPLCHIDPYYWSFFKIKNGKDVYDGYLSPAYAVNNNSSSDIGCFSEECLLCDVSEYCMGTYKSAFELYGQKFVNPIKIIKKG